MVQLLLDAGADVNHQLQWPIRGASPLRAACRSANIDIVLLLLENGASTQGERGYHALVSAVKSGSPDIVRTLLTQREIDIALAYDVPDLKALRRIFTYARQGLGSLSVKDEFSFDSPRSFGTALLTFGTWKKTGPAEFLAYDFDQAVRVRVEGGGDPAA